MHKIDHNKKLFCDNIKDLNKNFIFGDNNFKLNTINNLTNYFKKLKHTSAKIIK